MGKPDQGAAAAAGARRATGDAAGNGRGGRFSARRKRETVLRLLRGEDLESVSRELGITAARASQWRDQFLAAGQASLKSRAPDARDEANRRLQAKIGELLMENELLYAKVDQLEAATRSPRVGRTACSGSAACGTAPAPACMRGGRRRRPLAGAGRSAPPRTTSWSAILAACSRRRRFMAKGTGKPGRSFGSRESARPRSGCAG